MTKTLPLHGNYHTVGNIIKKGMFSGDTKCPCTATVAQSGIFVIRWYLLGETNHPCKATATQSDIFVVKECFL